MSENTRQDRTEPTDAAEENTTADETAGEATRLAVDPVTRVSGGGGQALRDNSTTRRERSSTASAA